MGLVLSFITYFIYMKIIPTIVFAIILLVASGCDSTENEVDFAEVPEIVLSAARDAVPGLVISRVEREETRRGTVYEVYGTANGRYYEIYIESDGTVIEIEIEDDDD